MARSRKRLSRIRVIGVLAAVILIALAFMPVTTSRAVDYVVSSQKIPLYEKAIHFLSRDLSARRLAAKIVKGAADDAEKIVRLRSWVRIHIRPVPEGWPTPDDHLWNVIVRGYGAYDQQAEVFALLASYAGISAAPVILSDPITGKELMVICIRTEDRTTVVDLARDIRFINQSGEPADVQEIIEDPSLVARLVPGLTLNEVPYERYFLDLANQNISFARIERQRPLSRVKHEVARVFGIGER